MVSRKQSVLAGVAFLLSHTLGEDLAQTTAELAGGCADIIQATTLCTEGGHCDCADYVKAYPCGQLADITVDDISIDMDRSQRCERHQLVSDLTRIAARVGEPMIARCNVLEEAIERTGEPPKDNKVSCGCLALIPEDEMPGMMNCMINDKFHGWHAHSLCKTIVQGRRRMSDDSVLDGPQLLEDSSWDSETERRMSLTVEEAEEEVNADPELLLAYESLLEESQTERRRQFVRDTTWRNVLTSGSIYHGGENYEAWQSGVCNATCGLCDAPVAPTPLADLPTAVDDAEDLDVAVNDDMQDQETDEADAPVTVDFTGKMTRKQRKKARKAKAAAAKAAAAKAGDLADAEGADPMRRLYEAIRRLIQ